jgi:hypothetical protein
MKNVVVSANVSIYTQFGLYTNNSTIQLNIPIKSIDLKFNIDPPAIAGFFNQPEMVRLADPRDTRIYMAFSNAFCNEFSESITTIHMPTASKLFEQVLFQTLGDAMYGWCSYTDTRLKASSYVYEYHILRAGINLYDMRVHIIHIDTHALVVNHL